jgi:hypothetical protein
MVLIVFPWYIMMHPTLTLTPSPSLRSAAPIPTLPRRSTYSYPTQPASQPEASLPTPPLQATGRRPPPSLRRIRRRNCAHAPGRRSAGRESRRSQTTRTKKSSTRADAAPLPTMASLFKVRIPETLIPSPPVPVAPPALTRLPLLPWRTRASCQRTGTGGSTGRRRSMR